MAYAGKAQITIDADQVSDADTANLTNFPALISGTYAGSGSDPDFRSAANGGDVQNVDTTATVTGANDAPADFAFFSDSGLTTQLDHEIQYYNATTGQIIAWVRIPTLDYNDDTVIYIGFNDSGVTTSQENIGGAWRSEFKGVWHMQEASGTRYDSSGNGNDLTDNNTVASTAGKIGTAADFEKDNSESLNRADSASTSITDDLSIVAWYKPETIATNHRIANKSYFGANKASYSFFITSDGSLQTSYSDDGTINDSHYIVHKTDSVQMSAGTLKHIGFTFDISAENSIFYVNGSAVADSLIYGSTIGASLHDNNSTFDIGARVTDAADYSDGVLEEVWLYAGILTPGWIATAYNNQNATGSFYAIEDITPAAADTGNMFLTW